MQKESKTIVRKDRAKERLGAETGVPAPDRNDITSLRGKAAQNAGFGIGMGLDYEVM